MSRGGAVNSAAPNVERLEPRRLLTTFIVSTTADFAAGSLREALTLANGVAGADEIVFDIPGPGPHTISPASPLPVIIDQLIIDGTTQDGFAGQPIIELSGSLAGAAADGLLIQASDCEIRGLVINAFAGNGVVVGLDRLRVVAAENNLIAGNYIGTDVGGSKTKPNGGAGVLLSPGSQHTTVGGATAAERNVISGNADGVELVGAGGAGELEATIANVIRGNYIGTDATGAFALGNAGSGVFADLFSQNTSIVANVISGNQADGILIDAAPFDGYTIRANLIGTDATGAYAIGNGGNGIRTERGFDIRIGGAGAGERNVVSGNGGNGILATNDSVEVSIIGNYVGTNSGGSAPIPNAGWGVINQGESDSTVNDNVISANGAGGLFLRARSIDPLRGNRIGTTADGAAPLGNLGDGIHVAFAPAGIQIGESRDPASSNIIAANQGNGLRITSGAISAFLHHNYIGTNPAGAAMGNGGSGVRVEGPVGGGPWPVTEIGDVGAPNFIAFNHNDGVTVMNQNQFVVIRANSIHSNGHLGIDLNDDGVTPNDLLDRDSGGNGLTNFPSILDATWNQRTFQLRISGGLSAAPLRRYRIDYYASFTPDPSGFGEGQRYVGSSFVTTNFFGIAFFNVGYGPLALAGAHITATATFFAPFESTTLGPVATSEFSRARPARIIGRPPGDPFPFPLFATRSFDEKRDEELLLELAN